jgi:hypothetical protein
MSVFRAALAPVLIALGVLSSNTAHTQERSKVNAILLTVDELRSSGIAWRLIDPKGKRSDGYYARSTGFPNKCYYHPKHELSVSDEMVAHFKERGFTLVTLCLAIEGYSRYDVETGNPLPLAVPAQVRNGKNERLDDFDEDEGILLNVPDCYKNGTPLIDCKLAYDFVFGNREEKINQAKPYNQSDHKKMSKVAKENFKAVCVCSKIKFDEYGELENTNCRLDTFPACASKLAPNQDAVGSLVTENYSAFRDAASVSSSQHRAYDISPSLPSGYGYKIAGPEGDDPDVETVDLRTSTKKSGTAAPWFVVREKAPNR